MCGARPLYLSAGFILEEGFPVADLQRIVASMAAAAARGRGADRHRRHQGRRAGQGRRLLHHHRRASGVLEPAGDAVAPQRRSPGDAVLVSGPIGDHGITVMLARGELDIEADIVSDTAPLHELIGGAARRRARRGPAAARRHPRRGGDDPATRSRWRRRSRSCWTRTRCRCGPRSAARRELLGHRPAVRGLRGPPGRGRRRATGRTTRWRRCGRYPLGARRRASSGTVARRPARPGAAARRRSAAPGSWTCWSAIPLPRIC